MLAEPKRPNNGRREDAMTLWETLARSELASWIQLTPFAFAAIESLHLVAVALFFGAMVLLDLRLVGIGPALPVRLSARHILPLAIAAFLVITITGILLFVSAADRYIVSVSFQVKVLLIILGGLNLAVFHTTIWRRVDDWGTRPGAPGVVKVFGALSILVWVATLVAGRWMGYEPRLPPGSDALVLIPWIAGL
jgi:hypothetical protein